MNLTEHFTYDELMRSEYAMRHGINNQPVDHEVMSNLHVLAHGLERVRDALGKPVVVTSGYRSAKVNSGVGGSKTSAHMRGLAADFVVPDMSPAEVCRVLVARGDIYFQTLIHEGTWTHIAFPDPDEEPAGTVLTAIFKPGQPTTYVKGIV